MEKVKKIFYLSVKYISLAVSGGFLAINIIWFLYAFYLLGAVIWNNIKIAIAG